MKLGWMIPHQAVLRRRFARRAKGSTRGKAPPEKIAVQRLNIPLPPPRVAQTPNGCSTPLSRPLRHHPPAAPRPAFSSRSRHAPPPLPFGPGCNGSHLSGNTKHETQRKKASLGLGWEHETPNRKHEKGREALARNTRQETRRREHHTRNRQH